MKKILKLVSQTREQNESKFKSLKIALILLYPVFIVLMTEFNHTFSMNKVLNYITENTNIFLFVMLVELFVFCILFFSSRSAFIATSLNSLILFSFSCVEYYKYAASGTHFVISDMNMIGNASDMTKFAEIKIIPLMVVNLVILALYSLSLYILNAKIRLKLYKTIAVSVTTLSIFMSFIFIPVFSTKVYGLFDMEVKQTSNSFVENDKFNNMYFYAFFIESATNIFSNAVNAPPNYNKETILALEEKFTDESKAETKKPNVIFILSESYADFRRLNNGTEDEFITQTTYKNFDIMSNEGQSGTAIVPTFGGYTSRTEFELMFGLPLLSLNTPVLPHNKLKKTDEDDIYTSIKNYSENGYNTTYIHPFSKSFYNRDEIYCKYGFSEMLFHDEFITEENQNSSDAGGVEKYIDDKIVFETIINKIKNSNEPSFIFAMTMQNHVPYIDDKENCDENAEYASYLQGIEKTDSALEYLRDELLNLDEECIIVFLGDHYPFFVTKDNKYELLNVDSQNCSNLYEQPYFVWNNFNYSMPLFNEYKNISTFYIPNMLIKELNLIHDNKVDIVLSQIDSISIYSQFYSDNDKVKPKKNKVLDLITYDVTYGEKYSLSQDSAVK